MQASSLAVLAHLYLLQGDIAQARNWVRQSFAAMEHSVASPIPTDSTYLVDMELAVAEGDFARALAVGDMLLGNQGGRGLRFFLLDVFYLKGRALYELSRMQEAEQLLQQAAAEAERVGSRRMLWRIYALLGEIERQQGNRANAAEFFEKAGALIDFIAAHTPPEYRESFLNLPEVRAVRLEYEPTQSLQ